MSQIITETMKDALKHFLAYTGLIPTRSEIVEKPRGFDPQRKWIIALDFEFVLERDQDFKLEHVISVFRPTVDGILDSDLVRERIKDPLEKRILELEKKCQALEQLIPIQHHYELEYELKHGRKRDQESRNEHE